RTDGLGDIERSGALGNVFDAAVRKLNMNEVWHRSKYRLRVFSLLEGSRRIKRWGSTSAYFCGECSSSIAAFTWAESASMSCPFNPAVEIGLPTRISSGRHLM